MTLERAQNILNHLIKTNQAFCFTFEEGLVSRSDCWEVIQELTVI